MEVPKILSNEELINHTLKVIEDATGLQLPLCDYFTGMHENSNGIYFNVVLKQRNSESREYVLLERFAKSYGLIKVAYNGLQRVAVFPNLEKLKVYNHDSTC